jgi:hypothetical protein
MRYVKTIADEIRSYRDILNGVGALIEIRNLVNDIDNLCMGRLMPLCDRYLR